VSDGILVVGYGNSVRSDDGIGWHVAQRLRVDPRFVGVTILQRHQLVPELAYDISAAAVAVFIDATTSLPPGQVGVERVRPLERTGGPSTHHVTPSTLVALSHQLYGRAADGYIVRCGVQSLEFGGGLSSVVEAAFPVVVEAVTELVWRGATG
jgi:hydrogenase maturation protease